MLVFVEHVGDLGQIKVLRVYLAVGDQVSDVTVVPKHLQTLVFSRLNQRILCVQYLVWLWLSASLSGFVLDVEGSARSWILFDIVVIWVTGYQLTAWILSISWRRSSGLRLLWSVSSDVARCLFHGYFLPCTLLSSLNLEVLNRWLLHKIRAI